VSLRPEMEDVSVSDHQSFLTRFAVSIDGATSFAVAFSETYSTAPRDVSAALAEQIRSMGLKVSKEHLTKIAGLGIETYCATPERNDNSTVVVCLVVPKDDTVKVVSFDAPSDLGWRRSTREIVESIKPGKRVQWGRSRIACSGAQSSAWWSHRASCLSVDAKTTLHFETSCTASS
jgi:hypothetical protein